MVLIRIKCINRYSPHLKKDRRYHRGGKLWIKTPAFKKKLKKKKKKRTLYLKYFVRVMLLSGELKPYPWGGGGVSLGTGLPTPD